MKVLITGSAGFVGSHLVEHILQNTNWEIIGIDSFKHRGDSLRVQDGRFNDPRYKVYYHDLNAPLSYRLINKIGSDVDYIINMASESHVDRSISDPVPFVQNNVNIALHMLEYARICKPKKFIQFSTDESFGPAKNEYSHKEWDVMAPSNPYAASKAAQESIAFSYWRTYGVPLIITNGMNFFAERQDPEKFIPRLIKQIYRGEECTIHGTPERISSRSYQHARNASDALLFLLNKHEPAIYIDSEEIIKPSKFCIVGERHINNLEMAKLVSNLLNKPLKYKFVDYHTTRPGHDFRYALDGTKLKELGWQQPLNLEESLRNVILWTLANPIWLK